MTDQPKKKGSDLLALIPKSGTAVAKFGDEQEVLLQLNIMRASVPGLSARKRVNNNGRWVETDEYTISDTEVLALFVASRNSGLRPDRGEIYVIPGQGVQVSAKIRASDAVTEASRWGNPLKIEYKQLRPGDPLWPTFAAQYKIEKDDTVALCEVVSEKGYKAWRMARKDRAAELKEAGFIGVEMLQQLDHEYGMTPPPMRAIGIVKAPENFDKGSGYERDADQAAKKAAIKEGIYSRYDRACKRAFARFCNQHGFSAPDRRNYGGIAVAEEPAEDQAGAVISKGGAGLVIDMPKKAPTRKDIFGSGEDAPLVGFTPGVIDATPVEATAAPEAPPAEPEDEGDEPQGALPLSPPPKKGKTPEEVKAAANTALAWADNVGTFAKQHYAQAQTYMDAAGWKLPKGTDMPAAFSEFKKWCAAQIAPAPEAAK